MADEGGHQLAVVVVVVGVGLCSGCVHLMSSSPIQFINIIINGRLGVHIKRVIELLYEVLASFFHLLYVIILYHSYM